MSNIRSMDWVAGHLNDKTVVIVDCRFALGQPLSGQGAYTEGHIPGAVYFDLERDMSGPKQAHGGRHPLPDWNEFARKLGDAGITREMTIVAYDDQGGAMASRFWWMLQYLGHERTYVMDQGFAAWKAAGHPVATEVPSPEPAAFIPQPQPHLLLGVEDVRARLGRPGVVLLDSREPKRYLGLEEPIDKVAGHIPGARNAFWKDGLTESGAWKPAGAQHERFAQLREADEIVVYCGSGVTACPNVLALAEAGCRNVRLYAGSWSDWCSYPDNPVTTGEE